MKLTNNQLKEISDYISRLDECEPIKFRGIDTFRMALLNTGISFNSPQHLPEKPLFTEVEISFNFQNREWDITFK